MAATQDWLMNLLLRILIIIAQVIMVATMFYLRHQFNDLYHNILGDEPLPSLTSSCGFMPYLFLVMAMSCVVFEFMNKRNMVIATICIDIIILGAMSLLYFLPFINVMWRLGG